MFFISLGRFRALSVFGEEKKTDDLKVASIEEQVFIEVKDNNRTIWIVQLSLHPTVVKVVKVAFLKRHDHRVPDINSSMVYVIHIFLYAVFSFVNWKAIDT